MTGQPLIDLLAALSLVLVLEGLVLAVFSRRLHSLLEQVQAIDPEQLRWGGLAMAVIGTVLYLLLRS